MLTLPPKPVFGSGAFADAYYSRAAQVYNAMLAVSNWKPIAIAALANADMESAFHTGVVGDGGTAFNLWQWHWNPRGERILAETGIDVRHETSIKRIVDALWWELTTVYPKALALMDATHDYGTAASIFCRLVEGAGAPNASQRRAMDAQFWGNFVDTHADFLKEHPAL